MSNSLVRFDAGAKGARHRNPCAPPAMPARGRSKRAVQASKPHVTSSAIPYLPKGTRCPRHPGKEKQHQRHVVSDPRIPNNSLIRIHSNSYRQFSWRLVRCRSRWGVSVGVQIDHNVLQLMRHPIFFALFSSRIDLAARRERTHWADINLSQTCAHIYAHPTLLAQGLCSLAFARMNSPTRKSKMHTEYYE